MLLNMCNNFWITFHFLSQQLLTLYCSWMILEFKKEIHILKEHLPEAGFLLYCVWTHLPLRPSVFPGKLHETCFTLAGA